MVLLRPAFVLVLALASAGCVQDEAPATASTGSPTASSPQAATGSSTPAWASAFASHVNLTVAGDVVTITTDAVPRHAYGPFPDRDDSNGDGRPDNPNEVRAQSLTLRVPARPQPAASPGALGLGTIALAVTGVPLFDARNANGQDAVAVEAFDACNGHPEERGLYHYHQASPCLATETPGEHSPVVGVALDGYAIHGLHGEGGDAPADLDACNGHDEAARGYHYHLTASAPYTIGCYHGTRVT